MLIELSSNWEMFISSSTLIAPSMKCLIYLNFSLFLLSIFFRSGTAQGHRFGYARPDQRRWGKLHGGCAGKYQSPIAISCNKAVSLNMPAIDMTGYRNLLPAPIKLTNNGHTISMSMATLTQKEKDLGEFLPYISGGKLEGIYEVNSLHFHWGDKNNRGAEHILNDVRYAMEMHIVHKNTKYKDVPEAMTYSDGLAVMAFFFEMSEFDGPELNGFVKNLPSLKNANDAVELGTTFSLHSLISSADLDRFYTYKGSLTTPPCSEAVTWVIFPDPLKISLSQLSKFRHLHSSEEYSPLVDNFRNVQPIGNRRIFVRKVNTQNQSIDELDEVHYSKWGWFT